MKNNEAIEAILTDLETNDSWTITRTDECLTLINTQHHGRRVLAITVPTGNPELATAEIRKYKGKATSFDTFGYQLTAPLSEVRDEEGADHIKGIDLPLFFCRWCEKVAEAI